MINQLLLINVWKRRIVGDFLFLYLLSLQPQMTLFLEFQMDKLYKDLSPLKLTQLQSSLVQWDVSWRISVGFLHVLLSILEFWSFCTHKQQIFWTNTWNTWCSWFESLLDSFLVDCLFSVRKFAETIFGACTYTKGLYHSLVYLPKILLFPNSCTNEKLSQNKH